MKTHKIKKFLICTFMLVLCLLSSCAEYDDLPVGTGPLLDGNTSNEEPKESLAYSYKRELNAYYVSGIGTMRSSKIEISEEHKGLPVIGIESMASQLVKSIEEIIIPDSITTIGQSAFYSCENLKKATLSKNLKSIGERGFYMCKNLSYINLPEGLERIGDYAFLACGITSIEIPSSLKTIPTKAFSSCKLQNVKFNEGLTTIGTEAFSNCMNLKGLSFPSTLQAIGSRAFDYCSSLTEANLPASLQSLGENPFGNSYEILKITVDENNQKYYSSGNCIIEKETQKLVFGLKNSVIPDGVEKIASGAFAVNSLPKDFKIPDSVKEIEAYAIVETVYTIHVSGYYIDGWLIKVPDIEECKLDKNCRGIASGAIKGDIIKEIIIPDGVKYINSNAFNCPSLTSLSLPKSLKEIKAVAFYLCPNLLDINFNGSMQEWQSIDKEKGWNFQHFNIICSDGQIREVAQ